VPDDAPHVYYSGPKLDAYLTKHHPTYYTQLDENQKRRVIDWRHGATANEYTVDTILTKLGSHLDLLPEDFKAGYKVPREATNPKERKAIVMRMRAGEKTQDLAREVDRTVSALLKWNRAEPGSKKLTGPQAGFEIRKCKTCRDEFKVLDRDMKVAKRTGQYCSRSCSQNRPRKTRKRGTEWWTA
jgi:hypothetical protein